MTSTLKRAGHLLLSLVVGLFLFTACDSSNDGAVEGRMNLRLTDAPLDSVAEVNVTIESINLVREDGDDDDGDDDDADDGDDDDVERGDDGIVPVFKPDEPVTVNLLDLTDSTTTLITDAAIPAGEYSQMRLVLTSENNLVFNDGTTERLQTPSAQSSGYKIRIPGFEIDEEGDVVDLTLDFDASRSIVEQGNGGYLLKPVVVVKNIDFSDGELEATDTEASGRLENVDTSGPTFTVEGVPFTATGSTDYDNVDAIDGLSSFSYASVEAVEESDGSYRALEVEAVSDADDLPYSLRGALDGVTSSSITVLGQTITVDSNTEFDDPLSSDTFDTVLSAGDGVEVTFDVQSDGSRLATSVEREDG
jgi:hypothetical protein